MVAVEQQDIELYRYFELNNLFLFGFVQRPLLSCATFYYSWTKITNVLTFSLETLQYIIKTCGQVYIYKYSLVESSSKAAVQFFLEIVIVFSGVSALYYFIMQKDLGFPPYCCGELNEIVRINTEKLCTGKTNVDGSRNVVHAAVDDVCIPWPHEGSTQRNYVQGKQTLMEAELFMLPWMLFVFRGQTNAVDRWSWFGISLCWREITQLFPGECCCTSEKCWGSGDSAPCVSKVIPLVLCARSFLF